MNSMELKSKFNLSLLVLSLSYPTAQAIAKAIPVDPYYNRFAGWTVGAGVGATTFMSEVSSDTLVGNASTSTENHTYKYGLMGNIFVGDSWITNDGYYYGLELGLNLFAADDLTMSGADQTNITVTAIAFVDSGTLIYENALSAQNKIKRNALEPYLDLKLGFLMTPDFLAYVRGGINYNQLELYTNGLYQVTVSQASDITTTSLTSNSSLNVKSKKDRIGIRVGAGLEYLLTPNIGFGANYVYTFYPHAKDNSTTAANEIACDVIEGCVVQNTNFIINSNSSNYDQEALVQLIYHFDPR